jgi:hypothetical protein
MSLMEVEGVKQAAESKDASKKITIGLWKFQIPNPENHPSFPVDVAIGIKKKRIKWITYH